MICVQKSKIDRHNTAAFTLIELLLVVAVIAVLVGLLVPAFSKVRDSARNRQAEVERRIIGQAIAAYKLQEGRLPAPPDDLSGRTDDRTYSDDNYLVMEKLLHESVSPPVLDADRFRWHPETGNVLHPSGRPYRITLDLNYDGRVSGKYRDYHVE